MGKKYIQILQQQILKVEPVNNKHINESKYAYQINTAYNKFRQIFFLSQVETHIYEKSLVPKVLDNVGSSDVHDFLPR